jgi:outer membrane usher protein
MRLDAEAALRVGGVVLESEFGYDGAVHGFRCPFDAQCNFQHREGFKRRGSRAVYDLPGRELRLTLGDTVTQASGFQSHPELLGVRLEHSPRTFSPGVALRPTGRQTFRIERNADVEVQINGATVQRIQLRPGTYNLTDLPLQAGANDITLIITEEGGERRTLSFTSFSDASLLPQGRAEWSGSFGLPSFIRDNGREYLSDAWIGSAFARYGLTNSMTGELNFQGDNKVLMGGGGIFTSLPIGFLGLQGALSQSATGLGYSAALNYDISNFKGALYAITGQRESFRMSAEYRSDNFRSPGEFQATASGILLPQYNYSWRFTAAYTVPFTPTMAATVSGRYRIGNEKAFKLSPLTVSRDRYGLDLSLTSTVTDWLSGSLTVGYGNDSPFRDAASKLRDDPEFRVGVRFYLRPGEKTRVTGRYDSQYNSAGLSGTWADQKGYERWEGSADVGRYATGETIAASAAVGYTGNRGEARVLHTSGVSGSNSALGGDHRTSVRAGTAIAFAGGKVAVGAPIRGNGFAIIDAHESIAGKTVTVGPKEAPYARTDALGPALVSNLPAYANKTLEVDVDDLPTGYSLGTGGFAVHAPYRGGYAMQVGSAYSVSMYGTLERANGQPVGLITGTATEVKDSTKKVQIFTNAAGRFGADGLAPGRWIIEMATEEAPTRFTVDIPKGTNGLFDAGTLKPNADDAKVAATDTREASSP